MRRAVAGYVQEIHRSYVAQALTFPPAVRGRMPLSGGGEPVTVAAVAARNLHILATRESLGPLHGQEVSLEGQVEQLVWNLRFYDSVVTPALALLDETGGPAFTEVRHVLGVGTVLYHLVAQPGSGLSAHQATHVGTGLANGHSAASRDFETIRARARGRERLVDELAGASVAGLPHAVALLARAIAPHDPGLAGAAEAADPDPDAIRKALVQALGGRTQWTGPSPQDAAQVQTGELPS
jgi:hypothetical protein